MSFTLWGISLALFVLNIQQSTTAGDAFNTNCTRFNGIRVGGQCYFIGPVNTTWTSAWTYCRQNGAILAQIHTENEFALIKQLSRANISSPTLLWIALRRDSNVVGKPSAITDDTTYWYDNVTSKLTEVGNTWVRHHKNEDYDGGGEYCVVLYVQQTTQWGFFDVNCDQPGYPLCQITSPCQSFTRTNTCLAETPIDSFTASQPQDCFGACAKTSWCRSFNILIDTNTCTKTCQLFTWSVLVCPYCPKTTSPIGSGTECHHYNHDP